MSFDCLHQSPAESYLAANETPACVSNVLHLVCKGLVSMNSLVTIHICCDTDANVHCRAWWIKVSWWNAM